MRSKYSLITKVSDVPIEDLLRIANSVWANLEQKLGKKRRRNKLEISLITGKHEKGVYGSYFPSDVKILIYLGANKYIRDFIQTIIHEYTHFLQPILKSYVSIAKKVGYDNHPFEIEARENEYKYYREFWLLTKKENGFLIK